MFTFQQVYQAYLDCRKNKRNTKDALAFETNQEENIVQLVDDLNNRCYQPTTSVCFYIKLPKPREVFAADFRDRVVHHLIYNALSPIWEKIFIYASFASRPGKGTHLATDVLQKYLRQITFNGKKPAYYLKLDVYNFFMSIYKPRLFEILCKKCSDEHLRWLLEVTLFHDPVTDYVLHDPKKLQQKVPHYKSLFQVAPNYGLPIGNLTSQFFANIFLNELDHFVKRTLLCHYYVRYVDDFILLATSPQQLQHWQKEIECFLARRLELQLNTKVTRIDSVFNGVDFAGFIVRPFYKLCRRRILGNCRQVLREMQPTLLVDDGIKKVWNYDSDQLDHLLARINAYLGHFKHARAKKVILKMYQDFPFLKEYFTLYFHKIKRKYKVPKAIIRLNQQVGYFQKIYKNSLVILQIGCYFEAFGKGAAQLSALTGYQIKPFRHGVERCCGFHQRFLSKVGAKLEANGINYVIIRQTGKYLHSAMERLPHKRVEFKK